MFVDEKVASDTERQLHLRLFSDSEMARRLAKLKEALNQNSIDALLLSDEPNVCYVSGMDVPSFATRARPIVVLIPAVDEAVVVCSRSQAPNARAMSWIERIETFDGFEEEAIAVIEKVLVDLGLTRATFGCELGQEQRLGLTYKGFSSLQRRLSGARWADAAPIIWPVRQIKSDDEIEYMRRAGSINAEALDQATRSARQGLSEREVSLSWARTVAELGGDRPGYLATHSGLGNYRRVSGRATERSLEPGDLLWMDAGAIYRQYWSDLTRLVAVGRAKEQDYRRYKLAWDIVGAIVEQVRVGMSASDLATEASRICASVGVAMAGPARIGHGIGLEVTEPPSVRVGDETILEPGMTLAIETGVADWDGYFVLEDNIVVGAKGAELLAPRASRMLPVVGE